MKKLLLIIDMQNDFITGSLGNAQTKAIVPHVAALIDAAHKANDTTVCYTMDTHGLDYPNTKEGKYLPVIHCVTHSPGWELVPELAPLLTDRAKCLQKNNFGSRDLPVLLEKENYDEITLAGVCTDICVITNALLCKTYAPEADIVLVEHACAGVTPETHRAALEVMKLCHIRII